MLSANGTYSSVKDGNSVNRSNHMDLDGTFPTSGNTSSNEAQGDPHSRIAVGQRTPLHLQVCPAVFSPSDLPV